MRRRTVRAPAARAAAAVVRVAVVAVRAAALAGKRLAQPSPAGDGDAPERGPGKPGPFSFPKLEVTLIDVHYWPTPNGHKITMFLEETGLEYRIVPVNIAKGDQFRPEFLTIAPNNRMPAIVDHDPADGGAPVTVFESGAILLYLADKTRRCIPHDLRGRVATLEWLFWQVGGLGPMAGQNHHFVGYAPERIPYAMERYVKETNRLYGVLDRRLQGREFIAGAEYTIADMASYPWIVPWQRQQQQLDDFPDLKRWFAAVAARPATVRAYALGAQVRPGDEKMTDEAKKLLFGQTAASVKPH
jgi:GST-like protein